MATTTIRTNSNRKEYKRERGYVNFWFKRLRAKWLCTQKEIKQFFSSNADMNEYGTKRKRYFGLEPSPAY